MGKVVMGREAILFKWPWNDKRRVHKRNIGQRKATICPCVVSASL